MEKEKQFPKVLLTGDRPTGRLHLGHLVGSIHNRLKLQDDPTITEKWYIIPYMHALTDNSDNPEKLRNNILQVVLDNLACGVDPSKMTIFVQSQVPAIAELTVFFMNLVTVARLKRNPTVKSEMKQKGYEEDVPAGFLAYPISQTADILFVKANTIPVGEDQLPVIEQANEIGHKFNTLYGDIFPYIEPIVGEVPRLIGTDGNAKMSKSLGNTIHLSDTAEQIKEKVMSMYTDPNHVRVEDPGQVEGNVVFTYLDIFDKNKEELEALKVHYRKGGLGDVVIKKRLIGILEEIIAPIREKREYLARDPKIIMDILEAGTKRAQKKGEETMAEVKRVMKINYF